MMQAQIEKVGSEFARCEAGLQFVADEVRGIRRVLAGKGHPNNLYPDTVAVEGFNPGDEESPQGDFFGFANIADGGAFHSRFDDNSPYQGDGTWRPYRTGVSAEAEFDGGSIGGVGASATGGNFGVYIHGSQGVGPTSLTAVYGYAYYDADETATSLRGLVADVAGWGSGTVTEGVGLLANDPGANWNGSTTTFGTYYGAKIDVSDDVATDATRFGVWIGGGGADLALEECTTRPAAVANVGRIFSEDNGSGKTRLMVQFQTGSPVQIAIEA